VNTRGGTYAYAVGLDQRRAQPRGNKTGSGRVLPEGGSNYVAWKNFVFAERLEMLLGYVGLFISKESVSNVLQTNDSWSFRNVVRRLQV
jgi:hypothetical protein